MQGIPFPLFFQMIDLLRKPKRALNSIIHNPLRELRNKDIEELSKDFFHYAHNTSLFSSHQGAYPWCQDHLLSSLLYHLVEWTFLLEVVNKNVK